MRTVLLVAGVLAAGLLLPAGSALAVGVDGVELDVLVEQLPGGERRVDVTTVQEVPLHLRNATDEERAVRLYPAVAIADSTGAFSVGDAGSAPWFTIAEPDIVLAPREERTVVARVVPKRAGTTPAEHVAFVLEPAGSDTLVTRAASVVRVVGLDPVVPRPLPLLLAALALVLLVGGAVTRRLTARRRGAATPAGAPAAAAPPAAAATV